MSRDRIIHVALPSGHVYDIRIGSGALSALSSTARDLKECKRALVISDENVGSAYGKLVKKRLEEAGFEVYDLLVPPGENSKSVELANELWEAVARYGFTRDDFIVACGGGVVGDLAGFVASTYMRGIDFIQVPTTLLAMVDSSIGGKTGVNLQAGKNLVGTFHQPIFVCSDIRCPTRTGQTALPRSPRAPSSPRAAPSSNGCATTLTASFPMIPSSSRKSSI